MIFTAIAKHIIDKAQKNKIPSVLKIKENSEHAVVLTYAGMEIIVYMYEDKPLSLTIRGLDEVAEAKVLEYILK